MRTTQLIAASALASLALTAVIVVALAVHLRGPPRALLAPLGAWTAFATYLNAYEVLADGRTGRTSFATVFRSFPK